MGRSDVGRVERGVEKEVGMRLGRIVRAAEEFSKRVGVVRAYHGSGVVVRKFDRAKTVDGTFWFSEDIGKIERGGGRGGWGEMDHGGRIGSGEGSWMGGV